MAATPITPPASGTITPTTNDLTKQQIAAQQDNSNVVVSAAAPTHFAPLDASKLTTRLTTAPREVPTPDDPAIPASNICTDHMVTAQWDADHGWEAPQLIPYGPLSIMPTASVLHYATECFEGLKLYRGYDGKLRLFRVSRNCERMRRSATRIALPDFDPKELEKLILALCARDGAKWLPNNDAWRGKFLYCRPTMIANTDSLGVQVPRRALLFVILSEFPDLSNPDALGPAPKVADNPQQPLAEKDKPVYGLKLLASKEDSIRAWPGGFGYAKLGANYGPSLLAQGEARRRGFHQILWLFGQDSSITEAGASNFFVIWKDATTGKQQLVTAPLGDKIILEGVTRASVLDLARERLTDDMEIVERKFNMDELVAAVHDGRIVEAFAAGTAYFIASVGEIEWKGQSLRIPTSEGKFGKYATQLRTWLGDIIYGGVEHEWGVLVDEMK